MMRQKRKQNLTIARLARPFAAALMVLVVLCAPTLVQAEALVTKIVTDPLTGVAIEGYDPVSYFTEPAPLQGKPDYAYVWEGVPWYFATPANRDVFIGNPEVYAPQFGGHCLMSLSRGFLSDGKPRLYVVEQMKLYLFYSVANREAFLAAGGGAPVLTAADAHWSRLSPGLTGEEPVLAVPAPADNQPHG
jgi:YHS domain-containing protein